MADLKTTFAGLELKNPIIVSSAGITETVEKMRRCQDNGAAAVVIKSYFEEEICRRNPSPRYHIVQHDMGRDKTFTFMSYEQASEWDLERYAEEVARAKKELEIKIIPSINCITTEGWVAAAKAVAAAGADAIELNTSCPHGSITFRGGAVEETIFRTVGAVRQAVRIPLIAKISPMLTSPGGVVHELQKIGVQGVTIFNRMTGLEIDVKREMAVMHGGYAGHGGPWAIQYPLRWITEVSPQVKIDIAGSGGVMCGEDAVKYILAGAQAVQVCTVVVLNGYEVIRDIVGGLERWMDHKGYENLASFRGRAAKRIVGTQMVDRSQKFVALIHRETHAPCVEACPAHVPAQAYVHLISQRDFKGALEAVRSAAPFMGVCAWVCYHPCEGQCTRGAMDEPISIRALKRFVIEWGERNAPLSAVAAPKAQPTGKKVAVIGSGPAGLAAAHDLARLGHAVTVFEGSDQPGGMLRWAIPAYRLPRTVVECEIDYIRRMGVEILCGLRLGRDVALDEVAAEYDAVVLAFGADQSARLGIPGEDAKGVVGAMDFLRRVAAGERVKVGKRVAVVGGGGSALDAARTALRLGAHEVFLIYRRSRAEMPIAAEEIDEAEHEGVRLLYLAMPIAVETDGGKATGLRVRGGYLEPPKGSHRRKPVEVGEIEYVLRADEIVVAVSQTPDAAALGSSAGVKLAEDCAIKTLDEFGTTSRPGVYAAGDVTGEAGSVIEAIAAGRRAALGVDGYLTGKGVEDARRRWGRSRAADKRKVLARNMERDRALRVEIPRRNAKERAGDFQPVETPLSEEDAVAEAQRCLRCGCGVGCMLCARICPYGAVVQEGVEVRVDDEKCKGCGLCLERCPLENVEAAPVKAGK